MDLSEAMKLALHHIQAPMTAPQIAYFLSANKTISVNCLDVLGREVQTEALLKPAHFNISDDFIQLSSWNEIERETIQYLFDVVQSAFRLYASNALGNSNYHNVILSLLLFKRLSDITRSQQHSTPIVPNQFKFNQLLASTLPTDLPNRLHDVFKYLEMTDNRLTGIFEASRNELALVTTNTLIEGLNAAMFELSTLNLNEDHVPTPIFQTVFSRMLLFGIVCTRSHLNFNS